MAFHRAPAALGADDQRGQLSRRPEAHRHARGRRGIERRCAGDVGTNDRHVRRVRRTIPSRPRGVRVRSAATDAARYPHVPRHRAFTLALLPLLRALGFGYLAAEALFESEAPSTCASIRFERPASTRMNRYSASCVAQRSSSIHRGAVRGNEPEPGRTRDRRGAQPRRANLSP
jgi:hypothetical protein